MINLKLAEYKDGKFERFLELGTDFLFGGNKIILHIITMGEITQEDRINRRIPSCTIEEGKVFLDEKDPLNRFDGLFDGRTYGGGRFIICEKEKYQPFWQDDCVKYSHSIPEFEKFFIRKDSFNHKFDGRYLYHSISGIEWCNSDRLQLINNIHENPELWEKVK